MLSFRDYVGVVYSVFCIRYIVISLFELVFCMLLFNNSVRVDWTVVTNYVESVMVSHC